MLVVHLLAYDGKKDNERFGKLGILLHDKFKWFIRKMIEKAHGKMEPVLEYKRENGWVNDHVAAMDEGWQWVISLDELPVNIGIGGFKGQDDVNRKLFRQGGELTFTLLDENTHYSIRVMLWLKWIHEHWDRFEIAANQAYQIQNFGNLYKDLLALSEPLPVDDGKDVYEPDYIKLGKMIEAKKNGMERNG